MQYNNDTGKYMIKTQTKDENKFMKRILPHYYKYITGERSARSHIAHSKYAPLTKNIHTPSPQQQIHIITHTQTHTHTHTHTHKENPHTLLVRILGMHRVKMYHLRRKVHFVIMASVFDTPEEIHTIYDLKGSLVGRQATQKQRENGMCVYLCVCCVCAC